jgi:serine carboxypeptidase-like clade 1
MRFLLWAAIAALAGQRAATAAPVEDMVSDLPGFGAPPTRVFSGFLDASAGCGAQEEVCRLHYILCLAEEEAGSKPPVVLWLNGGPGASSVAGMLSENGPLLMNATGGLMRNPYSWTKVAHLLVLEAPVGVGYSYCSSQLDGGICKNNDKRTASASRAALVDFYTAKFPELKGNDFFITGESYGKTRLSSHVAFAEAVLPFRQHLS